MSKLFPEQPILLVDDEPAFLQSLSLSLRRIGGFNNLEQCVDSRQVEGLLQRQRFSLAIIDLIMPHLSGDVLLEMICRRFPDLPVIILSGMNQVDKVVECVKAGAFDYHDKTGDIGKLVIGIRRALTQMDLRQECERLKHSVITSRLQCPEAFEDIVTVDRQMQAIFNYVEAIAKSAEPVLLCGESGVGKELIARAVHRAGRPDGPWVAVNVAGLDDNVFSDTLFGHAKGAFTGADQVRPGMIEQAHDGTLFLDEIGDLSLESQVKLLRLFQESEYCPLGSDNPKRTNARIVVATNQDLSQKLEDGSFRKDLYYRLRTHHVEIPPLRKRKGDLPLLLDKFLGEAACSLKKSKPTPPPELVTLLSQHPFPGNVRELRAMVFDAVSRHTAGKLSMRSFESVIDLTGKKEIPTSRPLESQEKLSFHDQLPTLKEAGHLLVREALRRTNGNQTMAAKLLGITQPSLSSRLKKMPP